MKKQYPTLVLLVLFFAGLIGLKLADWAKIPTAEQLRQASGLVFPELQDKSPADIQRLEVIQPPQTKKEGSTNAPKIVFERRDDGWQIIAPVNAAADPARLDVLVQNIRNLRKSGEAGTIHEPAANFGLETPRATIQAFGSKDSKTPLATLDVGKAIRDRLYVRANQEPGIEVVESRIFQGIDKPVSDWRDRSVFNLPTFQVLGVTISSPGHTLSAKRGNKHWELTHPFPAPADDIKLEETLGELTSLKIVDGAKGFVADDVRDLSPYGLGKEATKVELISARGPSHPHVLLIGSPSKDDPNKRYALRGDQDDVILVNGKGLKDLGVDPYKLRSKRVADIEPSLVDRLEIKAFDQTFVLANTANGWMLVSPEREAADADSIPTLLTSLSTLECSDFFDKNQVIEPMIDTPSITVKVWQGTRGAKLPQEAPSERKDAPSVVLKLGRHDALRRTVYAKVDGEPAVLALPDPILKVLPENKFAYRNRRVVDVNAAEISRLTINRLGQEYKLERGIGKDPNRWRLTTPVTAPADNEPVTKVLLILSKLTAVRWISDNLDNAANYGLDHPRFTVSWTIAPNGAPTTSTEGTETKTLRIGTAVPKETAYYYANIAGTPFVFTISEAAVVPLLEEFRDRRVISFPMAQVERVKLTWPNHAFVFGHHPSQRGGPQDWTAEPKAEKFHFDLSRIDSLVSDLSQFKTTKYIQHKGAFSSATGLENPSLKVQIELSKVATPIVLRVGNPYGEGEFYATTETGNEGTVFVLSGPGWNDLRQPPTPFLDLPKDVFAPSPPQTKP